MEEKPVRQAFGSPGGKTYLAPRIVGMIPPHRKYVEPFAGGAAVYFRKTPTDKEVLSDKDEEIAFAFRFLRDMTPDQFEELLRKDWRISRSQFQRLKEMKPKSALERFYRFYYLRKGSFGFGGTSLNPNREGEYIGTEHLWRVHERLKRTKVYSNDAMNLIDKHDGPTTFFYLDPPYPKRAFIGRTFREWTEGDLKRLVTRLRGIKGKFALSLGTEHVKYLPQNWHITKLKVWRRIPSGEGEFNQSYQYEIVATNYDPEVEIRRKVLMGRERRIARSLKGRYVRRRLPPPPEKLLYR